MPTKSPRAPGKPQRRHLPNKTLSPLLVLSPPPPQSPPPTPQPPLPGSDPPGIKLRAAKALEAVDYFVPGYWVFSKLIQSLSDIGYDNNNLVSKGEKEEEGWGRRRGICTHTVSDSSTA